MFDKLSRGIKNLSLTLLTVNIFYFVCPVSPKQLTRVCPDCPTLLPLHDPQGLESVKAAIEKFNKDSNQTSYFKVLEVGRLRTQVGILINNFLFRFLKE